MTTNIQKEVVNIKIKNGIICFSFVVFYCLVSVESAVADLRITQILYDPEGVDTGKEWIELYNPSDEYVSLDSYSVETGNGAKENDWTIEWNGTTDYTIHPKGYFLIGEEESLAEPDFVTNLDLQNGPDSCRLLRDSTPIDTVGWGDHSFEEYYEEYPTDKSSEGEALQRRYTINNSIRSYSFTSNNSFDFYSSAPMPKNSGFLFSSSMIEVEIEVIQHSINISNITMQDIDNQKSGTQVMLNPGKNRSLDIYAVIGYSSGIDKITDSYATFKGVRYDLTLYEQLSPYNGRFKGVIDIPYFFIPGVYEVKITAENSDGLVSYTNTSIELLSLAALEIDSSSLKFSNSSAKASSKISGDNLISTPENPTIRNIGNRNIDLLISGADLSSGDNMIPIFNMNYTLSDNVPRGMSTEPQKTLLNLSVGDSSPISFSLFIPENSIAGKYIGSVLISAVSNG